MWNHKREVMNANHQQRDRNLLPYVPLTTKYTTVKCPIGSSTLKFREFWFKIVRYMNFPLSLRKETNQIAGKWKQRLQLPINQLTTGSITYLHNKQSKHRLMNVLCRTKDIFTDFEPKLRDRCSWEKLVTVTDFKRHS